MSKEIQKKIGSLIEKVLLENSKTPRTFKSKNIKFYVSTHYSDYAWIRMSSIPLHEPLGRVRISTSKEGAMIHVITAKNDDVANEFLDNEASVFKLWKNKNTISSLYNDIVFIEGEASFKGILSQEEAYSHMREKVKKYKKRLKE